MLATTETTPHKDLYNDDPSMQIDVVYNLEFFSGESDEIVKSMLKDIKAMDSPDTRIGMILGFRNLAQTAAAQGWAYRALDSSIG